MEHQDYKKTLRACYLGFITQAICANFTPLLFLTFHKDYQISLGLIALIPVTFFFTQLVVDIFCAKFVDKIGYRVSIVTAEAFSAAGLIGLAFLPEVADGTAVAYYQSVKSPFVAQYLLFVACVSATWITVNALVGAHYLCHLSLLHQCLEGWQIGFP